MNRAPIVAILSLVAACEAREAPPREGADAPAAGPPASAPTGDSLALRAPGGTEIWFTGRRTGRAPTGEVCLERSMAIRRDGRTVAIPLLYTGSIPRLVNDSTIEAAIWLNCTPGNVYRVNLRTGYPVRVR